MTQWWRVKATGRRDTVEPGIVRAFRAHQDFSVDVIGDPADLLVGGYGVTHLVEIKSAGGKLTPAQLAFRKRWRGEPPVTVWNEAQARKWARTWRDQAQHARIAFPAGPVTWDEAVEQQREALTAPLAGGKDGEAPA